MSNSVVIVIMCIILIGCLEVNDSVILKKRYPETKEGVCQNRIDDDENGLIDCEEKTCKEWCNDNIQMHKHNNMPIGYWGGIDEFI